MKDDPNGLHNVRCDSSSELYNSERSSYPYQHILCKREIQYSKTPLDCTLIGNEHLEDSKNRVTESMSFSLVILIAFLATGWICAMVLAILLILSKRIKTKSTSMSNAPRPSNDAFLYRPSNGQSTVRAPIDTTTTNSSNAQGSSSSSSMAWPPRLATLRIDRSPQSSPALNTNAYVHVSTRTLSTRAGVGPEAPSAAGAQARTQDFDVSLDQFYSEALVPPPESTSRCAPASVGHKSGLAAPANAVVQATHGQTNVDSDSSPTSPLYSDPYEMGGM